MDYDRNDRTIWLYGECNVRTKYTEGETYDSMDVIRCLRAMGAGAVSIRINSVGGLVDEGIAIITALQRHDGKITTCIDAVAASIASAIFAVGDIRLVAKTGSAMLHAPHCMSSGNADELRETATLLDHYEAKLRQIYLDVLNVSEAELIQFLKNETWWTASDMIKNGFATHIEGETSEATQKRLAASSVKPPSEKQLAESKRRLAELSAAKTDQPSKPVPSFRIAAEKKQRAYKKQQHDIWFAAVCAKHEKRKQEIAKDKAIASREALHKLDQLEYEIALKRLDYDSVPTL